MAAFFRRLDLGSFYPGESAEGILVKAFSDIYLNDILIQK